jgi:hypothetical protein
MVRLMLETLKDSPEPHHIVEAATKYLRGVKGHLVQGKKRARGEIIGRKPNPNSDVLAGPVNPPGSNQQGLSVIDTRFTNRQPYHSQQGTVNGEGRVALSIEEQQQRELDARLIAALGAQPGRSSLR